MAMPAAVRSNRRYTFEEYVELDNASRERHEFHDGEVLVMTGTTFEHSAIVVNLTVQMANRLRGTPCRPFDSNLRVRQVQATHYVFPDLTIICDGPEFDAQDRSHTTVVNPRVVVEVSSPSTELYDRNEKFDYYTNIETLQEYVLVRQDRPQIETRSRSDDGTWVLRRWSGLEAVARLHSIGIDLTLREVYADVVFPPLPPPPNERE